MSFAALFLSFKWNYSHIFYIIVSQFCKAIPRYIIIISVHFKVCYNGHMSISASVVGVTPLK